MFIELTDHLRCPAGHAEQYLVLLPEAMDGRRVVTGELGCPVCGRVVRLVEGIADFGGARPAEGGTALTAEAVAAFLGLSGPGGYLALVGAATSLAEGIAALLPGIRLALVNPPAGTPDSSAGSVLRASRLPLKHSSMRGVVLGADAAADPAWIEAGVGALLPGLRVVVEGGEPPLGKVELLARTAACWIATRGGR